MTARDFCFWLQGFVEITAAECSTHQRPLMLSSGQLEVVRRHLGMVFAHDIDPAAGSPEHQQQLNDIHNATGPSVRPRC